MQTAGIHLQGFGCPKCDLEKRSQPKGILNFGKGINDLPGTKHLKSKKCWIAMLSRCYGTESKRHPTYIGCSVCDEWLTFSNFKRWFDDNYVEGYQLDKDLLLQGNKVYSPNTCCFIPKKINTMILSPTYYNNGLPTGVSKQGNGYQTQLLKNGKIVYLGYFNSIGEAFSVYKSAREAYLCEVAEKYFTEGKITERVYLALKKFKITSDKL